MTSERLKKNDELEVEIVRLGANGEGVAVHQGMVIFVPFALVGERVLIHIVCDKKTFYFAKIVKIIAPSKERVSPKCIYFSKCGGCDLQHMCESHELELKKEMVKNSLEKYAKIETKINDTIGGENEYHYRNKFAFPVRSENGELKIGMFQKNSHRVIEIEDCLLQSEKCKIILKVVKEFLINNKISAFDEKTGKGLVKHIVVREHGDRFVMSVVVISSKKINFEPLVHELKKHFEHFGIVKNVNTLNNNVIFGNFDENIYGETELEIEEFGIRYTVNNKSFLQVNDEIKTKIYEKIISIVGQEKNVVDAYSGAGLLSSILAKHAGHVYGVEIVKEATENANNLKKINNLNNLTNKNGDCAKIIPELAKELDGDFVIVVDPPRKGLDAKVVEAFISSKPKKIVYLSCDPATLARDLGLLKDFYEIKMVQPYNMFPQTANVETLVELELKGWLWKM